MFHGRFQIAGGPNMLAARAFPKKNSGMSKGRAKMRAGGMLKSHHLEKFIPKARMNKD